MWLREKKSVLSILACLIVLVLPNEARHVCAHRLLFYCLVNNCILFVWKSGNQFLGHFQALIIFSFLKQELNVCGNPVDRWRRIAHTELLSSCLRDNDFCFDFGNCFFSLHFFKETTMALRLYTRRNGRIRLFCFLNIVKFYNSLSTEIVNSSSSVSFKKALKAFFCNNYWQFSYKCV